MQGNTNNDQGLHIQKNRNLCWGRCRLCCDVNFQANFIIIILWGWNNKHCHCGMPLIIRGIPQWQCWCQNCTSSVNEAIESKVDLFSRNLIRIQQVMMYS